MENGRIEVKYIKILPVWVNFDMSLNYFILRNSMTYRDHPRGQVRTIRSNNME